VVFGADHIYRMDPRQMVDQHVASGAGVTIAAIRQPLSLADQFGVIETGSDGVSVSAFREKPKDAAGLPDAPDQIYASMGNYVFDTRVLIDIVKQDALDTESRHDVGGDIIPKLVEAGQAHVYDFADNVVPGSTGRDRGYWRDVGTLDAFYEAHMDLISVHPIFNLYNRKWPIYTGHDPLPPAKFVFNEDGRRGHAIDSMVSPGAILSGGAAERSILSPDVHLDSGASVCDSVLMDGVRVGRGAIVRNAIIDKNVVVPDGIQIGVDLDDDRRRFTVTPNGVRVVEKNQKITD
jgi:glucose-1-phosphate adenylyltransferase